MPIDAMLFGGRRATVVPLVTEAFDWQHGTFLGSIMGSETTAAAAGQIGQLRRDPFAMLPFCGYHMGDYFAHWLEIGKMTDPARLPRLYYVNWFRQDGKKQFLWPGYGENSRVLKWVFERVSGSGRAVDTPIGRLPAEGALDVTGLDISADNLKTLLTVDIDGWIAELPLMKEHYGRFGDRMPGGLKHELREVESDGCWRRSARQELAHALSSVAPRARPGRGLPGGGASGAGGARSPAADAALRAIKEKFAPDTRVAVFDVTTERRGDAVVVRGEVGEPAAKAAALAAVAASAQAGIIDEITVLPDPALGEQIWAS